MRKLMLVFLVVALTLVLVLGACAQPAPTPSPPPVQKPAPVASPAPAPVAAPSPAASPSPTATSAADFYSKNSATIIVGWGAGSGTDFAARLVAVFWPDAMGGVARVKNVTGGGGIVSTNQVWKAKPDGLTLDVAPFGTALAAPHLFKQEGKEFDIAKFTYVGMFGDEPYTLAIGKHLPYSSVADLKKAKGLKFGTSSKTGGTPLGCALGIDLLGLENASVVSGYASAVEIALAVARKELDGFVYQSSTAKAEIDKGFMKPIVNIGFAKSQIFPAIKPISEEIKLSPDQERLLKVYSSAFLGGRVVFATPGIPEDRVQFLRESFDKMVANKGFQDHTIARYQSFEPPLKGSGVEALIKELVTVPQSEIDKLNQLVEKYIK